MINNISEVQNILLRQAELISNPLFNKFYMMTTPGISKERADFLKEKLPLLSDSYLKIIRSYNLKDVEVGGFDVSSRSYGNADLVDGLLEAHEDPFFPKEFMEKHRMYEIGAYNTDILCVTAGTDQFKEGEILYIDEGYDIYNPADSQIRKIAKDFEQFLIVAGNLEEIHTEMGGDDSLFEQKRQEFIDRLHKLGVDEDYHKAWLWVF